MPTPWPHALAAALAALALTALAAGAEARPDRNRSAALAPAGYRPAPVVRDHRAEPQPYVFPRRWHRHDRRH